MVVNARIADLIRENRVDEISDAIADGAFFNMQTFTQALIDLVVAGVVDRETAANASSSKHDFLVALDFVLKQQAVAAAQAVVESPVSDDFGGLRIVAQGEL